MNTAPDSLSDALAEHGVSLTSEQTSLLDRYCHLLWEWNEKINLTRHTDYQKFVSRDLIDSLAIADNLGESEKVLDVGTGAGFPGLPLAIICIEALGFSCGWIREMRPVSRLILSIFRWSPDQTHH